MALQQSILAASDTMYRWLAWSPVTGCTKISEACLHCYAERTVLRLQGMGQAKYRNGFQVTCHEAALQDPFQYKRSQMIFVSSLGDLFHPAVPDDFIQRVFDVMHRAHWHTFQVLTKRAKRLQALAPKLVWSHNIWMGVTVESDRYVDRIAYLVDTPARIKWLCLEPLLSAIHPLPLKGVHWVIASGENAPDARPTEAHWVADIQNQCREHGVAFHFKKDPRALTHFPLHSVLQCAAIRKTLQDFEASHHHE